jgi:hypothetical protein
MKVKLRGNFDGTTWAARRLAVAGLVFVAASAAGCGTDDTSGASPAEDEAAAPSVQSTFDGDMTAMPRTAAPAASGVERASGALSSGAAPPPKLVYLMYADGKNQPSSDYNSCVGPAPKFNCTFAPTLAECQREIQAYLDKWYADFNVVFTLTKPASGTYYTVVVSSGGGAWCDASPKVAGVSPFSCSGVESSVSNVLLGGQSAKQTAIIIAHEQGHLLGLEHVADEGDIMNPTICSGCDGFEDQALTVTGDRCARASQNSYAMMKASLGAWPGGPKPSAFGCDADTVPPTLEILSPADGAAVTRSFTLSAQAKDDCFLSEVHVEVSPIGLAATSTEPPFTWDLANISGHQTITITAIDGFAHVTKRTISVTAPLNAGTLNATLPSTGCAVSTTAYGVAGCFPALGVLLVFSRRRRAPPRRRRAPTGAYEPRPSG